MRTWGRINGVWYLVQTDSNGNNDAVALTWLCQVLKLNLYESPFYADWGIPAKQSVQQQVFPDLAVSQIQQLFAAYFASLIITRIGVDSSSDPVYQVAITTHQGAKLVTTVGAPT